MNPKRKSYRRTVTALVDADPTYLSVVSAGANGSPFNVVKHEEPDMNIKKRTTGLARPKTKASKNANNRVDGNVATTSEAPADRAITKFFYNKDNFADEQAVRDHIEKSDFEGNFTVTEETDQFVVSNDDLGEVSIKKTAQVDTGDDGVTAEVALLGKTEAAKVAKAEGDEEDEGEETEAEGDDTVDPATGYDAGANVPADQLPEDGEDEAPEVPAEDKTGESEQATADNAPAQEEAAAEETDGEDKDGDEAEQISKRDAFLKALAEGDDEDEDEAVEEPSKAEALAKFDFWSVYDSASSDFLSLLKEGSSDGIAPGMEDVMWTFGKSVRNALNAGDDAEAKLSKNATDFVSIALSMHNLFANIVEADMAEVVEKSDEDRGKGLTKWAKSFGRNLIANDETLAKAAVKKSESNNRVQAQKSDDEIAKIVKAATDPLNTQITELRKSLDNLSSRRQISKSSTTSDDTMSEPSGDAIATPTKKAADPRSTEAARRIAKVAFAGNL